MGFHRATSMEAMSEAGTRVVKGVGIGAIKASRRSRCPLMPPLKVHNYSITTEAIEGGVIATTTKKIT